MPGSICDPVWEGGVGGHTEVTGREGAGLCIMYLTLFPANPDLMYESVCLLVSSSVTTTEVIIYVSTAAACASGCCMYRKTLQKVSMHTSVFTTAIYNSTVFISLFIGLFIIEFIDHLGCKAVGSCFEDKVAVFENCMFYTKGCLDTAKAYQ